MTDIRIGSAPVAAPSHRPTIGRMALETGTSIAAGVAAEQFRRSMLRQGNAVSVLAGLAGAAAIKTTVAATVTLVENHRAGRPVTERLGGRMLDGLRTGMIDGGLAMLASPIQKSVGRRLPTLGPIAQAATTGTILGSLGGAAMTATNHETWQDGAATGLKRTAAVTAFGGVTGAVLGGATGAVMKRFLPDYTGGPATRHQVRTLTVERGTAASRRLNPVPEATWEATVANAKTVGTMKIDGSASMQTLRETSPELQTFLKTLKPGDILLVAKGDKARPQGDILWATKSPYMHAMMVTEVPQGEKAGRLLQASIKGVTEDSLLGGLKSWFPKAHRPKLALTVIRPTEDAATAQAAVAFAREQIGKPYNFTMSRGKDGYYCSQIVFDAFEANPAIKQPPIKLLQLSDDTNRMAALQGIGTHPGLWRINERQLTGVYKAQPLPQRLAMMAKDGWDVAVGSVKYGITRLRQGISPSGGATYAHDYRQQLPALVSPGDLNLADGRKLHTLTVDWAGK